MHFTLRFREEFEDEASRFPAERQHLLDLTGIAPGEYDPHARETAVHAQQSSH
ncbi:MAG: hypothetical protein OEV40_14085 [Acidimicrobiia bacterium]|nr:hypothetical protein [Acidimicrobiia bacterium]